MKRIVTDWGVLGVQWRWLAGLVLLALLLAGCATVTFRRGAQPDEMAADERACRAEGAEEAQFVACMRRRGWSVATTGFAPASAPAAVDAAGFRTGEVEAPIESSVDVPELVRVDSWWKRGAGAESLDLAIAACVAALGDEHRPDAAATVVTTAMRDCLRASGWHALGGSPSRP